MPNPSLYSVLGFIILSIFLPSASSLAQDSQTQKDIDHILDVVPDFDFEVASPEAQEAFARLKDSPTEYIAEIDARLSLPGNKNLINYPRVIDQMDFPALLGFLGDIATRGISRADVVSILVRMNTEVVEDMDLIKDELSKIKPADSTDLKEALLGTEYLYMKIFQILGNMRDSTLLSAALEQYASQSLYMRSLIEDYSLTVTGGFPPPDTIEVKGGKKPE